MCTHQLPRARVTQGAMPAARNQAWTSFLFLFSLICFFFFRPGKLHRNQQVLRVCQSTCLLALPVALSTLTPFCCYSVTHLPSCSFFLPLPNSNSSLSYSLSESSTPSSLPTPLFSVSPSARHARNWTLGTLAPAPLRPDHARSSAFVRVSHHLTQPPFLPLPLPLDLHLPRPSTRLGSEFRFQYPDTSFQHAQVHVFPRRLTAGISIRGFR